LLETTIIGLHFADDNIGPKSIFVEIFMVGSGNFVYFCKSDVSAVQGRSSKVIDFVPFDSARVHDFY